MESDIEFFPKYSMFPLFTATLITELGGLLLLVSVLISYIKIIQVNLCFFFNSTLTCIYLFLVAFGYISNLLYVIAYRFYNNKMIIIVHLAAGLLLPPQKLIYYIKYVTRLCPLQLVDC